MGNQLFDQYSLLHFATGVTAYHWGVPALNWFMVHVVFEIVENTEQGMKFINETITFWPGGKPRADTSYNIIGDNISTMAGWWCASKLDEYGKKHGWYKEN